MSTAQRTEPGTGLARQGQREQLDRAGQQHIAQIKATRALTIAITNESWGKSMTPVMRTAFAEYMRRFHLDISEIDNLGGKPYKNGRYYERKIAEMRTKGLVEWTAGDHIGPNPELAALAAAGDEWAINENIRRTRERIRWEVPADATHAYVTRVKLKGDKNPLEGCDFITPLRVKKVKKWENGRYAGMEEKIADPVGAEEPEKTVITRAWRRVGLLAAAEIPELKAEEDAMEIAAEEVGELITEERAADEEREERASSPPPGRSSIPASSMPLLNPADPYSEVDTSRTTEMETVGRSAPVRVVEDRFVEQLATVEQKARITALLSDPKLDLAATEIERVAGEAGKRDYTAERATTQIAQLERLIPKGEGLFGEEG